MSLQHELHPDYHTDRRLRDRLLNAVDIPTIQDALRDRTPRISQQLINRVANRLSTQKRTAGMTAAHLAEDAHDWDDSDDDMALYSLGQKYGGDAKRHLKSYVPRRQNCGQRQGSQSTRPHGNHGRPQLRLSSVWMRGVKGCLVCGQSQREKVRHTRDEVTAAINKLKEKLPSALITIADVVHIVEQCNEEKGSTSNENDIMAEWAEEDEGTDDSTLTFIAEHDLFSIEESLDTSSFLHGRSFLSTRVTALLSMRTHLNHVQHARFHGVRLDMCANRR